MSCIESFKNELYGDGYDPASFKFTKMAGPCIKTSFLKIPHVKEVAFAHVDDNELNLESFPLSESVELTMAYFFIALKRCRSLKEQYAFLDKNLVYAKSWMLTDAIPQVMKKANIADYLPFFMKWSNSKKEYTKRFAYVYLMKFISGGLTKEIALGGINFDERYYVYMGQSWFLATYAIKDFSGVMSFLSKEETPDALVRKTLSKMMDSYRISEKEKELIKTFRAKRE